MTVGSKSAVPPRLTFARADGRRAGRDQRCNKSLRHNLTPYIISMSNGVVAELAEWFRRNRRGGQKLTP